MLYCRLQKKDCPHLRKASRTILPIRSGRREREMCYVCSKLPRTENIVQIAKVFDGEVCNSAFHKATCCPLSNDK